jgi:hypothetical protein
MHFASMQAEVEAMVGEVKAAVTAVEVDAMPAIKAKQVGARLPKQTRDCNSFVRHTPAQHSTLHRQPTVTCVDTRKIKACV